MAQNIYLVILMNKIRIEKKKWDGNGLQLILISTDEKNTS